MPGNFGAQARCFRNFTDRFREGSYFFSIYLFSYTTQVNSAFRALRRLAFTGDGVVVGVVIRCVERYDQVKIQVTESVAEHRF